MKVRKNNVMKFKRKNLSKTFNAMKNELRSKAEREFQVFNCKSMNNNFFANSKIC